MKATEVVYNVSTGALAAAGPMVGDEPVHITEAGGIDVVAGDDVRVRTRGDCLTIEPLNDRPLLLRHVEGDGSGDGPAAVRVRTQFEPDAPVEMGGLKEGAALQPPSR